MIEQLTKEQAQLILSENVFGHIGCNDGFNTYVFPTNYVYDGKYIIGHTQLGTKVMVMRQNKRVCFQVDDIKNFIHWKSVMVLGEYQELHDTRERYQAIKAFIDHMLHLKKSKQSTLANAPEKMGHPDFSEGMNYVIYRIVIDEISGRFEEGE
jgi:nitroimidazol reductase NimA-like FMN-containing flavoprotein (pyridoxamine 5'-phosphate oxidase superfamily)